MPPVRRACTAPDAAVPRDDCTVQILGICPKVRSCEATLRKRETDWHTTAIDARGYERLMPCISRSACSLLGSARNSPLGVDCIQFSADTYGTRSLHSCRRGSWATSRPTRTAWTLRPALASSKLIAGIRPFRHINPIDSASRGYSSYNGFATRRSWNPLLLLLSGSTVIVCRHDKGGQNGPTKSFCPSVSKITGSSSRRLAVMGLFLVFPPRPNESIHLAVRILRVFVSCAMSVASCPIV